MTNSDITRRRVKEFDELCKKKVEALVEREQLINYLLPKLTLRDIGTKWWRYMWFRTKHDCFNYGKYPPFPEDTRVMQFSKDIYLLPLDNCWQECNGNGGCTTGRCTCKNGYYGEACEHTNCPNSLVYVDIDTINKQYVHHCSLHGDCVDAQC